ncbi:hypothetical protein C8R46DRAFT_909917 [Mycena filopes]|nr:hypothetical protein C8R46DRAFT_909917 [Mycena filopes]
MHTLSLDNAAPNDVLIRALSRILRENFDIQFNPDNSQIRCLAHVVNLVVQKLLAALDEAEDPAIDDYYLPRKDLPFHYDPDDDPDVAALETEVHTKAHEGTAEEDADVGLMAALAPDFEKLSAVGKLRATVVKICSSPQRRKRFKVTSKAIYKDALAPSGKPLCTLMVVRDAIDQWVIEREELRPLLLSAREWELLEKLGDMLRIFSQVTLQMSRSKAPTLPWVLPMYEHMLKNLKMHRDDATQLPSLRAAATAGLEKLETYYEKAKGCQFNVIATVLHPFLGISWFRKMGEDRGENATTLFNFVYESYKTTHDQQQQSPGAPAQPTKTSSSFLDDVCMLDVPEPQSTPLESELERFYSAFRTHGRGAANDPLAWWKVIFAFVLRAVLS